MEGHFTFLDWLVIGSYFGLLFFIGYYFSKRRSKDARDYFLGGNNLPYWVVAISVLATSQSAATFLGGPDQALR